MKKGHGGTTARKVRAAPPNPMKRASLISWRKKPTMNEMALNAVSYVINGAFKTEMDAYSNCSKQRRSKQLR